MLWLAYSCSRPLFNIYLFSLADYDMYDLGYSVHKIVQDSPWPQGDSSGLGMGLGRTEDSAFLSKES